MLVFPRHGRLIKATLLAAVIMGTAAAPSHAQPVTAPSSAPITSAAVQPTATMPPQQSATAPASQQPPSPQAIGGLNCLMFGTVAAAGVYIYNDILMVAITGYVNPTLLIPAMAGAFVAGCGIGNTLTPGLIYLRDSLF